MEKRIDEVMNYLEARKAEQLAAVQRIHMGEIENAITCLPNPAAEEMVVLGSALAQCARDAMDAETRCKDLRKKYQGDVPGCVVYPSCLMCETDLPNTEPEEKPKKKASEKK